MIPEIPLRVRGEESKMAVVDDELCRVGFQRVSITGYHGQGS